MSQKEGKNGQKEEKDDNRSAKPPTQPSSEEYKTEGNRHNTTQNGRRQIKPVKIFGFLWNKNNQAQFQNMLTFLALGVAIWLAIVTYQVYKVAAGQVQSVKDAGDAAKQSAQIAQRTFVADTLYNYKTLQHQKIADNLSRISDSEKSKLAIDGFNNQKRSVDAQINQFNSANEPFLDIGYISNFSISEDKIAFKYVIDNLTNRPVKVLTTTRSVSTVPKKDTSKFLKDPFTGIPNPGINTMYVSTKDTSNKIVEGFTYTPPLKKSFIDEFNSGGNAFIYFVGKIDYINNVNNKRRRFEWVIQIYRSGKTDIAYSYIRIDNYDVK